MRLILSFFLAILISGCTGVELGKHQDQQTVNQTTPIAVPPAWASSQDTVAKKTDLESAVSAVRQEFSSSNQAQQNSITGLGVQLGKIGERVEGIHAEISTRVDATVSAQADLNVSLNQKIQAQATLNATAITNLRNEINTEIRAQIAAQAQAQAQLIAGVGNKTESSQTTSTAGRDSITFSADMAKMNMAMFQAFVDQQAASERWHYLAMMGMFSAFASLQHLSHRRALSSLAPAKPHQEPKKPEAIPGAPRVTERTS